MSNLAVNTIKATLQKIAQNTELSMVHTVQQNPELAVIPLAGLIGANLTDKKRKPIESTIRGGAVGAATGAGLLGGSAIGRRLTDDSTGNLGGGVLGGLLAYLAARKLTDPQEKSSASPLQQLLVAKRLSDAKDYKGKHAKLRALIEEHPNDFIIDSINGDIAGVTHLPLNFRIHAPLRILPPNIRGLSDGETRTT
jgi:hypothetical protein